MSAALLKKMREMGLSLDQAIELMEAWETETAKPKAELSKGALRTRRWRENKEAASHGDVTVTRHGDDHEVTQPLSLPPSPQTPQPPAHSRVCDHSREARAREEAGFARFWAAYPRKVSKADARKAFAKAWRKLGAEDDAEGVLIGGLERAKASWVDAQFIPHAATWLNGERWNDEPTPSSSNVTHLHERPHTLSPAPASRAARRGVWAEVLAEERGAAVGGGSGT